MPIFIKSTTAGTCMRLSGVIIVSLSLLLAGCSASTGPRPTARATSLGNEIDLNDSSRVKKALYAQHSEWRGTRYKMGGLSKKGIDCSGFAYQTFRSRLGYQLPRTTESQSKLGKTVSRRDLRAGDLVFFKTGITVRHVGMYLENGKFLHASTSRGVMISNLDNVYWKKKYWKAQRL